MGLAEDLLTQAQHLASLDSGRPKQANLRRAISSSYDAVFHLLVGNAVLQFIPRKPAGLIPRVSRAFQHSEMKQACFAFKRQPLANPIALILGLKISTELQNVATTFIDLQEFRHAADYDIGLVFSRAETLSVLATEESLFAQWKRIEGSDEATVFLAALAFAARWNK